MTARDDGKRAQTLALALSALTLLSVVAGVGVFSTAVATAADVSVDGGTATPHEVEPGTTVDNQAVRVSVDDVSADGDTDTFYVEFPNALASGLSANSASANDTSITSSVQLVDGYDDDGTDDTLTFATSASGGGAVDLTVTVDASVDYPDEDEDYAVDVRVEDSRNGVATTDGVASIDVGDSSASDDSDSTSTDDSSRDSDSTSTDDSDSSSDSDSGTSDGGDSDSGTSDGGDSDSGGAGSSQSGPGFGVTAAVAAVLGAALLARRHRR